LPADRSQVDQVEPLLDDERCVKPDAPDPSMRLEATFEARVPKGASIITS
jgi:hypothetical protein